MGAGLVAAGLGAIGSKRNQKKLDKLLKNAPKYNINQEAYDNQALARGAAFGRDRSIQMQQAQQDQQTVDATSAVKEVTNDTSSLLGAIAAIQAGRDVNTRNLASDEAQLQNQKMQQLLTVNNQMIDEKDKAWNYNTNMPFQMKVASLRDRVKANNELLLKGVDAQAQTDAAAFQSVGQMFGAAGGMLGG